VASKTDSTERNIVESNSRELFDYSPTALFEEDYSSAKLHLDALRDEGVTDIHAYFAAHPESIVECAKLVTVLDVNEAALSLHKALRRDQLTDTLTKTFVEDTFKGFQAILVTMWEGRDRTSFEAKVKTLDGDLRDVAVGWAVSPRHNDNYARALASLTDITARKNAEDALKASEERFATIFAASPTLIAINRLADGVFREVNDMFVETAGYARDEMIGRTSVELDLWVNPGDRLSYAAMLESDGKVRNFDVSLKTKSGARRECVFAADLTDLDGELHVLTAALDITERKRAETAIREQEEQFRLISDNLPALILQLDKNRCFQFVNKTAERWLARRKKDILGRHFAEILGAKSEEKLRVRMAAALNDQRVDFEETIDYPDGVTRDIAAIYVPIHDTDGETVSLLVMVNDVTERKLANDLALANRQLMELDRLKSMFIASMSHELRTPLNSIIGFSGIMLDGMLGAFSEEQSEKLGRINRSAKHLLDLITDVIDISKIEAGRLETRPEHFNLKDIVTEAVEECRTALDRKGLLLEIDASEWPSLFQDRRRVLQCLLNLLSNAEKYSETGRIVISIGETDGWVDIAVKDTGIGISKEEVLKLFEPFERFDSHLRIKAGGTGLGLYLTKKIVTEMLRGTVQAESRLGDGSTFTLHIPSSIDARSARSSDAKTP